MIFWVVGEKGGDNLKIFGFLAIILQTRIGVRGIGGRGSGGRGSGGRGSEARERGAGE
jgi:hypothetical protein